MTEFSHASLQQMILEDLERRGVFQRATHGWFVLLQPQALPQARGSGTCGERRRRPPPAHAPPGSARQAEFLVCRDQGIVWLVRWLNGSITWESRAAHHDSVPAARRRRRLTSISVLQDVR